MCIFIICRTDRFLLQQIFLEQDKQGGDRGPFFCPGNKVMRCVRNIQDSQWSCSYIAGLWDGYFLPFAGSLCPARKGPIIGALMP